VNKAATGWHTYRTRFLVQAKQLARGFSFLDAQGREHHGKKGDYLIQCDDGARHIAPRKFFEDVYVAMDTPANSNGHAIPRRKKTEWDLITTRRRRTSLENHPAPAAPRSLMTQIANV